MNGRNIRQKLRQLGGIYSQGPEQKILSRIFRDTRQGVYVDVGAHHPVIGSNSYAFYRRGWRGLVLEPNPALHERFRIRRPRDILIDAAAGDADGEATFYLGRHSVHSSLCKDEARHDGSIRVRVRRLGELLRENGIDAPPDLVSIDTEGTEIQVLEGLNLERIRPHILCIEYNTAGRIETGLQPYLTGHGYSILALSRWNVIATDRLEQDYRHLPAGA